jgi:hypothetical protein
MMQARPCAACVQVERGNIELVSGIEGCTQCKNCARIGSAVYCCLEHQAQVSSGMVAQEGSAIPRRIVWLQEGGAW